MKYIFRGNVLFEYKPEKLIDKVIQPESNLSYYKLIDEDYKLLSQFFKTVYEHTKGEDVELVDIIVN